MNLRLIAAATSTVVPVWFTVGVGVFGIAKVITDLCLTRSTASEDNIYSDTQISEAVNQALTQLFKTLNVAETDTAHVQQSVELNFEAMDVMYDQYGERGVYAYLVENGFAKDRYHGEFLIKDIFMPERERRRAANEEILVPS